MHAPAAFRVEPRFAIGTRSEVVVPAPLRCVACGFEAHSEWPHREAGSAVVCRGPFVGPDLPTVEIHLAVPCVLEVW